MTAAQTVPHRDGSSWPTASQRLLLHAALDASDEDALGAWRRWRADNDFDSVEGGSFRLLPVVYRRLAGLAADPLDLKILKDVYRREWYGHQVLARRAASVLERLHEADIPTLVLKGAALSAMNYGTRPMQDVDVLVPTADAHRAVDVFLEDGWTPEYQRPHARIAVHHSQSFDDADQTGVDLHWHALNEPADDRDFWGAAVPVVVGGVDTLAPCPTDQLLHVCVHGRPRAFDPPMRWIADAVALIRGGEPIDWQRLADRARARGVSLPLRETLAYLTDEFAAGVPSFVVTALAADPKPLTERLAHRAATRLPAPNHVRALVVYWDRWRRLDALDPPYALPSTFPHYLSQHYGFAGPPQLVAEVARRAVGRGREATARGYKSS